MIGNDFDQLERQWDGGARRVRPKAAARQRAGDIVAQAAALQQSLVYWEGTARASDAAEGACQPLAAAVAQRLAGRPAGIYLVDAARRVIVAVTAPFLASISYQVLVRSRSFPRALAVAVGDLAAWRQRTERRLVHVRAAFEAGRTPTARDPAALHLEGASIWMGTAARRPSRRLPTETIQRWLLASSSVGLAPIVGAVVLGQRQWVGNLPPALRGWWQVGRLLSAWPPDLIAALPPGDLGRICRAVHGCARLNSPEACAAVIDFRLTVPDAAITDLLVALPTLFASLEQYDQEPRRRWGKFVQHLTRAFEYAAAAGLSFALAEALRATGEDRGRNLGSGEGVLETVNTAARWFLGRDLPASLHDDLARRIERVGERFRCANLRRRLDGCRPKLPLDLRDAIWIAVGESIMDALVVWHAGPTTDESWNVRVGALAGRLAATGAPEQRLTQLAAWLDHCRATRMPVDDGGALRQATEFVGAGMAAAETQADWERFLEVLANHGAALLAASGLVDQKEVWPIPAAPEISACWKTLSDRLPVLTCLGVLDGGQVERVMAGGWIDTVRAFLPERRAVLPNFIDWLTSHPQACQHLWADVFLLPTPALVPLLTRWVERLVGRQRWSWADAEHLLRALHWKYLEVTEGQALRQVFLARHFWIVERLVSAVQARGADAAAWFSQRICLIAIAYHWQRDGHPDLEGLIAALLTYCERIQQDDVDPLAAASLTSAVALAAGQPQRLLAVLHHAAVTGNTDDIQPGWQFLTAFPGVRSFLSACADQPRLLPRVFGWLRRLSLLLRLPVHDFLHAQLRSWESPAGQPALDRLRAYRQLAGDGVPYPDAVARVLDRPRKLAEERATLEQRQRAAALSSSALVRLEKLNRLQAQPERLAQWMQRDLAGLLARQVPAAQLAALEAAARPALHRHWESILGVVPPNLESPDWDNALRLWQAATHNRRTLKSLLRRLARGDQNWIAARAPNRAFLERIRQRGVQIEAWLGPTEQQYAVGAARWTVRIETDPLKVLWMGRLFGTCLSPGDCNAFAAVANAVEANKRVLYLTDGAGRIIGRKLLVLSNAGVIFGFRSYGRGEDDAGAGSPWDKLLFDLFTRQLAGQMGARLAAPADEKAAQEVAEKQFHLFARWYHDGFESFDDWLLELDGGPALAATRQAALDRLQARLEKQGDRWARDDGQSMRMLLWLGPAATAIVQAAHAADALTAEQLAFLTQHGGLSAAVGPSVAKAGGIAG